MQEAVSNFVLRLPASLHLRLKNLAITQRKSLNQVCTGILESGSLSPFDSFDFSPAFWATVAKVKLDVKGVLLYGSYARGDNFDDSDIALMVVVSSDQKIDRKFYRKWDEAADMLSEYSLDVHFSHLPESQTKVKGIWAELATEGLVLWEHNFQVSRYLIAVRKLITTGTLKKKKVHGHSYWTYEGKIA